MRAITWWRSLTTSSWREFTELLASCLSQTTWPIRMWNSTMWPVKRSGILTHPKFGWTNPASPNSGTSGFWTFQVSSWSKLMPFRLQNWDLTNTCTNTNACWASSSSRSKSIQNRYSGSILRNGSRLTMTYSLTAILSSIAWTPMDLKFRIRMWSYTSYNLQ